jgi:F-type H+-transporting ATPase subunit alpha
VNIGAYDGVEVKDALRIEKAMRDFMKSKHTALVDRIESTKDLSKDDEAALTAAIADFKKNGAY